MASRDAARRSGRSSRGSASCAHELPINELHERVSRGDTSALNELAERLLQTLPRRLRRVFSRAPADSVTDAIEDAILEYGDHPSRLSPTRSFPLDRLLQSAAARNVANLLQADARRRVREAQYSQEVALRRTGLEPEPSASHEDSDTLRRVLSVIPDDVERIGFVALLDGERSTCAVAEALGLSHLSLEEQRRAVKRFRERIVKRLIRHFRHNSAAT